MLYILTINPSIMIQLTSFLAKALNIDKIVSVESFPPTVEEPNAKPSITKSLLITTPAIVDNLSCFRKLSAIPKALIPFFSMFNGYFAYRFVFTFPIEQQRSVGNLPNRSCCVLVMFAVSIASANKHS